MSVQQLHDMKSSGLWQEPGPHWGRSVSLRPAAFPSHQIRRRPLPHGLEKVAKKCLTKFSAVISSSRGEGQPVDRRLAVRFATEAITWRSGGVERDILR